MIVFWCLITLMLLLALAFAVIPLWKINRKMAVIILLLMPMLSLGLYLKWGASQLLAEKETMRTPALVIQQLQRTLQQHPSDAEGWYWLGRLYFSEKDFSRASQAFARVDALAPPGSARRRELMAAIARAQAALK
jgi:cytochrome c-type biogenesis protein CcmH